MRHASRPARSTLSRTDAAALAAAFLLLVAPARSAFAATADSGADGSTPRLTLADVFEFESVSDPQIAPDGSSVVYVRTSADIGSDRFVPQLWQVRVDSSQHRPLTSGQRASSSPRFSPDGTRIAYISSGFEGSEDTSSQIWVHHLDSGIAQKLTHHAQPPSQVSWSPDGQWLSFVALVPSQPEPIAKLPAAPPGAEWAEPAKVIDRLFYKFDPIGYLPQGTWHVFVVSAEGGTARQLTQGDVSFGGPGLRTGGPPIWTPDSKHLLVSANLRPESDLEPLDSEIYEVSVATGAHRALTDRRGPDAVSDVSPDGRTVLSLGFDDRYQGYQLTNLYATDRDGGNRRQLVPDLGRSVDSAAFSPDGDEVIITYTSEGEVRIAMVDAEKGTHRDLTSEVGGGSSAYAGAAPPSIASNGRMAVVTNSSSDPGDIAVIEPDGKRRVLTEVNEDLLSQREVGTVEEIWYESSHDGRRVHGWIIKPPGFDPTKKYPLILEIHGGPFAAYGPGFDVEKQLMAASGYVVLYTNPRGSTSYGEEFGNLIHHDYPGDDFYDLMSGVDAVIAQGYIDPEQLYVTGGSGGGVLTSWVIGRSDRFRAAVTVYPVINWYSWVLTADIAAFGVRYWFPGMPWDHAEHYEKRSLLSVVKNVKTPTMVLTGEADYRTPMSDSEQYFTALRLLGVESVLVRYPDENHGIRRRPSHWMGKIGHIIGWMDRYRD